MKPRLNKLITLLLLLSTFAFLTNVEQRVSAFAQKELSGLTSLLPVAKQNHQRVNTINPYANQASILNVFQLDSLSDSKSLNN